MPKDTDEELQRLQQALFEEEDAVEEELPEIIPEEDPYIPDAGVYQNFSNDYGRKLRNYASGYRAYNTDQTDTDLEDYSKEVRQEGRSLSVLRFIVFVLALLIVAVCAVLWKFLRGMF